MAVLLFFMVAIAVVVALDWLYRRTPPRALAPGVLLGVVLLCVVGLIRPGRGRSREGA